MSNIKRTLIAVALTVVIVPTFFLALYFFPVTAIERAAVAVAYPLAYVLAEAAPGHLRQLSPGGGPDSHTWAITISIVITWLAIVFIACFLALGRMRSNRTPHADARDLPASASDSGTRAGGRER